MTRLDQLGDVFDVKAAAAACDNVDPRTIRAAIARGELKAVRIGRLVKITKPALLAYLGLAELEEAEGPKLRVIEGAGDG